MGFYAPRVPSWNRLQEMTVQAHLLQMGEKKKNRDSVRGFQEES